MMNEPWSGIIKTLSALLGVALGARRPSCLPLNRSEAVLRFCDGSWSAEASRSPRVCPNIFPSDLIPVRSLRDREPPHPEEGSADPKAPIEDARPRSGTLYDSPAGGIVVQLHALS
jgi:hypothetical protein